MSESTEANVQTKTGAREGSPLASLLGNIALIAVISATAAFGVQEITREEPQDHALKIAFIDTESLAKEEINALGEAVRNGSMDSAVMAARSKVFSESLLGEIRTYSDQGYVVLRSAIALAYPADIRDITSDVRMSLQEKGVMHLVEQNATNAIQK